MYFDLPENDSNGDKAFKKNIHLQCCVVFSVLCKRALHSVREILVKSSHFLGLLCQDKI